MFYAEAAQQNALAGLDPITSTELQTPEQQERGYGDDVARILERPPQGTPKPELLRTTLGALSPQMNAALINSRGEVKYSGPDLAKKAIYQAALAMSYSSDADSILALGYDESQTTFAAAQAILLALGYKQLSDAMILQVSPEETREGVTPSPIIKFMWGRNRTEIAVTTPYDEEFKRACQDNREIFLRFNRQPNGSFYRFFRPEFVPNVVNLLAACWANTWCLGVEGNLTVLPTRPFVEVPFPVAPLPPMVPVQATGERAAPPAYNRGDRVRYQGQVFVVVDAAPGMPQRLGLRPDGQGDGVPLVYVTVHEGNVQMVNAAQAVEQIQAERNREAAQDGEQQAPPIPQADLDALAQLQIPESAYEHQVEGIKWLWLNRRGILGDDPGLGKSLQAVCASEFPALVVCPSKLKVNWMREFGSWRPGTICAIISGTELPPQPMREAQVVIINYDILTAHADWIKARNFATIIADEAHNLKNMQFRSVELPDRDAQGNQIISSDLDRAKSPVKAVKFFEIQKENPRARLYLLTGTAVMNARSREIFPLLHMVDDKSQPFTIRAIEARAYQSSIRPWQDYRFFCARYAFERDEEGRGVFRRRARPGTVRCGGASRLPELYALTAGKPLEEVRFDNREGGRPSPYRRISPATVFHLKRKKDLLNLPPLIRQQKHVSLSDDGQRAYRHAVRDFVDYVRQLRGTAAAVRAALGQMLVKMNILRRLAAVGKVEALLDEVLEFRNSTGRPLIIMAYHKDAMTKIVSGLEALNLRIGAEGGPNERLRYGVVGWDGGRNAREEAVAEFDEAERARIAAIPYRDRNPNTQAVVDAFQGINARGEPAEPTIDIVIMNIAVSVGLTLTRASDMFFVERMWRPSDLVQAEARMERIGQRNRMVVTYYDAPGTIDEMIANLLIRKAQVIAGILEGRDLGAQEAAIDVLGQLVGVDADNEQGILDGLADMLSQQLSRNARNFVDPMPALNALPED